MFQSYNLFNAIAFSLVFLLILETINISTDNDDPEKRKPQWIVLVFSIIFGSIAGFDRHSLTIPPRR